MGRANGLLIAEQSGRPFSEQLTWAGDNYPHSSYAEAIDAYIGTIPQRAREIFNPVLVDGQYEFQNTVSNINATTDQSAEGFEIEMVASPISGLRLMANISKQETIRNNTAAVMGPLIEQFVASLNAARLGELEEDPSRGTDSEPWGLTIDSSLLAPIRQRTALDGTISPEQRKWRFTMVGNYEFQEGKFKGFGVGGAYRWEDEAATGYTYSIIEGVPTPNINNPFFDDGLTSGDAWVSYKRKIMDQTVDWSIKLNVRNLIGEDDDLVVRTNPDGNVAVVRIPNARTIYLTNTFSF